MKEHPGVVLFLVCGCGMVWAPYQLKSSAYPSQTMSGSGYNDRCECVHCPTAIQTEISIFNIRASVLYLAARNMLQMPEFSTSIYQTES